MLKIENLSKTFNKGTINEKKAMNNLSLSLNTGDFVTVIGSNGAGKSTLLNLIAGTLTSDSGKIFLDDIDVTKLKEYKRSKYLSRVFQDPMKGTASNMMIEENLAMANRRGKIRTLAWGVKASEREGYKQKLNLLDLGLENRMTTKIGLLSGGQRQAITLLMASLQKPKLLLLDEHTAALDPKTAKKVLQITNNIVTGEKLTTLMITHNMKDAITYGNRLIMMHSGNIIFDIKGDEKKNLTVRDLLQKFENLGNDDLTNDRMLLG